MSTLEWIGKKAVVNHHREVPFRLLQCVPALSVGGSGPGNLLVQGDNLETLKASIAKIMSVSRSALVAFLHRRKMSVWEKNRKKFQ